MKSPAPLPGQHRQGGTSLAELREKLRNCQSDAGFLCASSDQLSVFRKEEDENKLSNIYLSCQLRDFLNSVVTLLDY